MFLFFGFFLHICLVELYLCGFFFRFLVVFLFFGFVFLDFVMTERTAFSGDFLALCVYPGRGDPRRLREGTAKNVEGQGGWVRI